VALRPLFDFLWIPPPPAGVNQTDCSSNRKPNITTFHFYFQTYIWRFHPPEADLIRFFIRKSGRKATKNPF
jgi:hypothetical protein